MYKIIGSDGKEYGPISLEQLKQWVLEGRLNKQSKVLPEGTTDWRTVGELPELDVIMPPAAPPQFSPLAANDTTALKLVRGPAIFILVLSILNILASLWGLLSGLLSGGVEAQLATVPDLPPEYMNFMHKISFLFGIPASLFGIAMAITCLIGSLQMMKLKSYGFAMAAAIIMLIPCSNCCCCLNIGAGIWALIVLTRPHVKSSFR